MVYMATSWNEPQGSPTSLSQELGNVDETNAHTKTDFRDAAIDISGNKRDDCIKVSRDDIEPSPMRPRSFSDVSLSKFRHRKSDKAESDPEKKQSMKVIICRESKVITDSGRGRKLSQDKIQYSGSEKPVQLLSRSKSAHGRSNIAGLSEDNDEIPPPKPALPKSYRANCFLKQLQNLEPSTSHSVVKHGLDKPEDYRSRSDVLGILAEWRKGRSKHQDNLQVVADLGKSGTRELLRTDCKRKDESDQLLKETKSDTKEKDGGWSGVRENSLASEKNSKVKLTRGRTVFRSESKIALFRSHDAKLRAIALKRELDTLRNSEHVKQRLSSTEHYDVADLKKELDNIRNTDRGEPAGVNAGERIKAQSLSGLKPDHGLTSIKHGAKTPAGESKNYDPIKSSNQGPYSRYRNELSSFNNTDRSQNKVAASERAYPPSGALTEANISRGAVRTNQRSETIKTKSDNNEQLPYSSLQRRNIRSKSESSIVRKGLDSRSVPETNQNDDSNHSKDEGDISRGTLAKSLSHLTGQKNNLQEEKSATQIKRKQDTIRKFNYDSVAQVREKVRSNYQRKPDRNDSESPEYVDIPMPKTVVLDKQLLAEVSDDGASLGDNRSDEEKYAALSRSKILHNKSSSLDSQPEPSRKARQHKKVVHPVIKITSSSSLTDYRSSPIDTSFLLNNTSSSTDSLDVYLSENKGVKHEKFNTDIPPLPKKTINSKAGELKPEEGKIAQGGENTTQQKVVLRQCRIGSDVAFSLIGLKKAEPEPNGNGFLDGQGLVTLRMIPDEQGRFGFNVKGGADQGMPIIVSRVAPNTPADNCIPRLNEGDQVLFINGRDVSQHTHEQVVMFIRASRETHSGELVLKIRPNVYTGDDNMDEPDLVYDPDTHQISSASGANALEVSLKVLEESLESGAALAQFEQLYRKKPGMTMNAARLDNNIPKNRYRDISPYDQTRVMIKNGTSGDYINANYVNMEIPVSGIVNRYIAAQGPLPTTCTDFWQMVWEQQSTLVVMLTTKVERGRIKCHQYWPDNYETSDFGTLQITCVKEEETTSFAFREFNLTNVETNEERHISHMQYIAWPDHGVPDDPADFLEFVVKVRQKRVGIVEPVIVHCSAGIGRTGVLITMETAMGLIEANQPVYPLSIVRQMRDQRAMLIQTPSQYKFVCEAIIRSYNEGIAKALPEYQR